jgi:short subunit dehydrogenase-like uncharacterized protein
MLLPGVGFDVVPSDCLAAHLKRRLPTATALSLGFQAIGRFSRGTATTMVENLANGGMIRRGGVLTRVPAAWRTRAIDCGRGPVRAMTIPWGDVSAAYRSTGIPDIEVYMAAALSQVVAARLLRLFGWAVGSRMVQNYLKSRIKAGSAGPTDEERARGESLLWGEATDAHGGRVASRIRGPEGYTLTASSAVAVVARVLKSEAPPGFQTPSLAYGADFVLTLPGVSRSDELHQSLTRQRARGLAPHVSTGQGLTDLLTLRGWIGRSFITAKTCRTRSWRSRLASRLGISISPSGCSFSARTWERPTLGQWARVCSSCA